MTTPLEKVYSVLLFMLLVLSITFGSLYSSQVEKTEALTQEVHTLTGQIEGMPKNCYVRGIVTYEPIIIVPAVKGIRRENREERTVVSVDCY